MKATETLGSGLAGALALTAIHETIKKFVPDAPRMDAIGKNIVKKIYDATDEQAPDDDTLYNQALAGDIALNSLLYSLVGTGKGSWMKGLLIGAGAGVAAVLLPKLLDFKEEASSRTNETAAMTIAIYAVAGLAAAGVKNLLHNDND